MYFNNLMDSISQIKSDGQKLLLEGERDNLDFQLWYSELSVKESQ